MGKTMNVDSEGRFVKEGAEPAPRRTSAAPNSQNPSEVQAAIELANELGLRPAAAQLGMAFSTLRNWRTNMKKYGRISIPQEVRYPSQRRRATPVVDPEPKIQRAARRAPLRATPVEIPEPRDVNTDIESTFERGFHRGFNAAVTLFKIDLTGEEGANE
jgi:transposase-like protein